MFAKKHLFAAFLLITTTSVSAQTPPPSSYMPVISQTDFQSVVQRMEAEKPALTKRHQDLLHQRYDLNNQPSKTVTMTGGKPVQEGVRTKLPLGVTWEALAQMTPEKIKARLIAESYFSHCAIAIIIADIFCTQILF